MRVDNTALTFLIEIISQMEFSEVTVSVHGILVHIQHFLTRLYSLVFKHSFRLTMAQMTLSYKKKNCSTVTQGVNSSRVENIDMTTWKGNLKCQARKKTESLQLPQVVFLC